MRADECSGLEVEVNDVKLPPGVEVRLVPGSCIKVTACDQQRLLYCAYCAGHVTDWLRRSEEVGVGELSWRFEYDQG